MISNNLKKRFITSVILLIFTILIFLSNFILIYSFLVLGVFSFLEFSSILKKIKLKNYSFLILNLLFFIYLFLFCYLFVYFSYFFQLKIILYLFLLSCVASDIGGYTFGKIFKGMKLTKISPNKTVSGAIGSIILTLIVFLSFFDYYFEYINLKIILIGTATSILCQLGDLFFSYLKRKVNIKDTGNFFPGHGGVLDRIDGILIGVPFGFFTLVLLY